MPEQRDPCYTPRLRYGVEAVEVEARLSGRWTRQWLRGWRDICCATDAGTLVTAVVPRVAVNGEFLLILSTAEPALRWP